MLDFDLCCGRYHAGAAVPTAEALMRARYAAYATGNIGFIAATNAGPAAVVFDRAQAEAAQLGTRWLGLEIVGTRKGRAGDSEGTVSFIARYSQNGAEDALSETSVFRRIGDRWVYWDRLPEPAPSRAAAPGRNDPCPCGSGRKFKKCCGA
ncbi:YchJ family metal-binding protein [Hoeflea olei]|nr:YchJ family metal-binding protein [Hoeflea olei]